MTKIVTPKRVERFRSMSEFVRHVSSDTDYTDHRASRERSDFRAKFTQSESWEDALSQVFRWEEGASRIGKIRARIGSGVERQKRERLRTMVPPGTAVVGAIMTGHPKPIIAVKKSGATRRGSGKVYRIVVNACASGGVDASILETRGGAALALADAIERRGGKVELVVRGAFSAGYDGHPEIGYDILVKRPSERLNLNSVAFALAHPSMLRRLLFSALEVAPEQVRKPLNVGSAYGYPADFREERDTLYLPKMMYGDDTWESEESAIKWVMDYLTTEGFIS